MTLLLLLVVATTFVAGWLTRDVRPPTPADQRLRFGDGEMKPLYVNGVLAGEVADGAWHSHNGFDFHFDYQPLVSDSFSA